MKGLNVKRIAALGIGAALVGSALAPAVMAGVFSNVDSLQKTSIVNSTGTPVVDIVVGSMGQAADVVWAGNIAAKVAQLATVDATNGAPTVDFTVGGTTSVAGAGHLKEVDADFANAELTGFVAGSSKMPTLVNESSAKLRYAGNDVTTTVKEELIGSMNATVQTNVGSSQYASGELVSKVEANALSYIVSFGSDMNLAQMPASGMDNNSDWDIKIPFLGKTYIVDGATSDSLILYADTTPQRLYPAEEITVQGAGSYVGKTLTLTLDTVFKTSDADSYRATWVLRDGSTVINQKEVTSTSEYDLRTTFGTTVLMDSVHVTNVALDLVTNKYYASIRSGTERLELKRGRGFPWNGNSTEANRAQWKVEFLNSSDVAVTASTDAFRKIKLTNQWAYTRTSGSESESSNDKYVLKVGESVVLPNNFAKFQFNGMKAEISNEALIGDVSGIENGGLSYVDLRGNRVDVPFYKVFGLDYNIPTSVTIGSREYTFYMEAGVSSDGNSEARLWYIDGDNSDFEGTPSTWAQLDLNYAPTSVRTKLDTNISGDVLIDLGSEDASGAANDINYVFAYNYANKKAALLLKANDQTFNVKNDGDTPARPIIKFVDSNVLGDATSTKYYYPNASEFVSGVLGLTYSTYSGDYTSANFVYTDNNDGIVDMYVRTTGERGTVWNYEGIKNETGGRYGPVYDAEYNVNSAKIRDNSDYFSELLTQDGSIVSSDNSKFTIVVPEKQRRVEAYLGSTSTTPSTVGGSTQTGVAVGETKGNVTITGINGAAGKTVVKVGNIVKLDTDAVSGKAIIVGGHLVNNMAANLSVEGQTLQERLVANGDYVAAVLDNGSVVVAGWNANDTASAARALIDKLESFM